MTMTNQQNQNFEAPRSTSFAFSEPASDKLLCIAVICLMTAVMLALFQFPVRRIFTHAQVNYNEGWNAYRTAMVAKSIPLYRTPPHGMIGATAYPPVSFHVVSLLGNANTFTIVGRLLSLFAVLAS